MSINELDEITDLLERAKLNLDKSKYLEAKQYYQKVLNIDANDLLAKIGLIHCDFQTSSRQSAINELNDLAKENPTSTFPLLLKGELEIHQGGYDEARKCFVIVKEIASNNSEKQYCQLMIYWVDGDLDGMTITLQKNKFLSNEYPLTEFYYENLKLRLEQPVDEGIADKMVAMYANNSRFLFFRGLVRIRLEKYQDALEDFIKSVDYRPTTINSIRLGDYYCQLGITCSLLKRTESAIEYLIKSFEIDPNESVLLEIAKNKFYLGHYNESISEYTNLINSGYDLSSCYYFRGICYFYMKDFVNAEHDFKSILKENKDDPSGFFALGILEKERDISKAKQYFDLAKQNADPDSKLYLEILNSLDPKSESKERTELANIFIINKFNDFSYADLGHLHSPLGKPAESIHYYNKAIEHNPNSSHNYFKRGLIRFDLDDDDCIDDFNKTIFLDPISPLGYLGKGLVCLKLRQSEEADRLFTQAIKNDVSDSRGYEGRSEARFQLSNYRGALSDINDAINKKYAKKFNLRLKKTQILYESGKIEEAISEIVELVNQYPNSDEVYVYFALIEIKQKKSELAKNKLLKAIEINNQNKTAYYYLGQLEEKISIEGALKYYEKAEELGYSQATNEITRIISEGQNPTSPKIELTLDKKASSIDYILIYIDALKSLKIVTPSFKEIERVSGVSDSTWSRLFQDPVFFKRLKEEFRKRQSMKYSKTNESRNFWKMAENSMDTAIEKYLLKTMRAKETEFKPSRKTKGTQIRVNNVDSDIADSMNEDMERDYGRRTSNRNYDNEQDK